MGIEPTQPAWKAGILTIELHPQLRTVNILANKSKKVNINTKNIKFDIYLTIKICYTTFTALSNKGDIQTFN